jgi:hypothetical protein
MVLKRQEGLSRTAFDPKPPCGSVVTHLCLLGDFTCEHGAMQRWHGCGRGHMLTVGLVIIQ